MAANFNRVIIMGNLTRDPELRTTSGGKAVTDITLAINDFRPKGDTSSENTTFVDVTVWERAAETVCQYMRKGSSLLVEGRLSQDKWQDKETGKNMSKLRVIALSVQFVGSPRDGNGGGGGGDNGGYSEPTPAPRSAPRSNSAPRANSAPAPVDDFAGGGGEDIPF